MFHEIKLLIDERLKEFDQIPAERKTALEKIAAYVSGQIQSGKNPALIYICTHNSRRSHFGQISGAIAAAYYNLSLKTFSGGTMVTAFNPNAIAAIEKLGFQIDIRDNSENPVYDVYFSAKDKVICFSKLYDDPANPVNDFAAIMTCSDAEENCPFIPNAAVKISTTYDDPKSSDGSGRENDVYTERFKQILRETLYAFSHISL